LDKEEEMSKVLDARGLSCPQPVMMALEEIKAGETDEITIMVDTDTAKENVSRAVKSQGWSIGDIQAEGGSYSITIKKI
jgi:tRNA 2-thiouridine synthesizing protein A